MSLKNREDLDRILDELDVDHIPSEFVKAAKILYTAGEIKTITPKELEEIMCGENTLEELGIKDIRLVLDLTVIKSTIRKYSAVILSSVSE